MGNVSTPEQRLAAFEAHEKQQRLAAFAAWEAQQGQASEPPNEYPPEAGMSTLDYLRAGAGKGMVDVGRGIGQVLGLVSDQDVADSRRRDAPIMKSGAGMAGNIGGTLVAALPTMWIPGANTVTGAAAVGAGLGALQPALSGGERMQNLGMGGAGGAGGVLAGRALAGAYHGARAMAEPFSEAGRQRIAGRTIQRFADNPLQVLLAQGGRTITGATPTLAEVTGDAGMARLQDAARSMDPQIAGMIDARLAGNNAARVATLERIAGTDADRAAADAARRAASKPAYDAALPQVVDVSPELEALLSRPDVVRALGRAERLAANEGRPFGLVDPAQPAGAPPAPGGRPSHVPGAAQARAPMTQAERQAARLRLDIDTDDALTAIRKAGGLDMQDPWIGELAGRFQGGARSGFGLRGIEQTGRQAARRGGSDLPPLDSDRVIELLYGRGYILTPDWHAAEDALLRASRGEKVLSTHGRAFDLKGEEYAAAYADDEARAMAARGEHPYRHSGPSAPPDLPPVAPVGARPATLDDLEQMAQAERAALAEGDGGGLLNAPPPSGGGPRRRISGAALQDLKLSIDAMLKDPGAGIAGAEVRALQATRAAIIDQMERAIPEFRTARTAYAEGSRPLNQMDIGRHLLARGASATEDLAGNVRLQPNALARMLQDERHLIEQATGRRGAGNALADVLTPEQYQAVQAVASEVDRAGAVARAGNGPGSATAQRLAAQNILRQVVGATGLPASWAESVLANTAIGKPFNLLYGGVAEPRIQQALAAAVLDPAAARAAVRASMSAARQPPTNALEAISRRVGGQSARLALPVLAIDRD